MNSREKLLAYGSWVSVCLFWGTTFLGIRICLETMPPLLMGGFRFLIAGSVLFIFMRFFYGAKLPQKRELVNLGFIGFFMLAIGNGVVAWSEQHIHSGMTALLVATFPFWVAGMESLTSGGERLTLRIFAGMLLGFTGLTLLVAPAFFEADINKYFVIGVIVLQIGSISWTAATVYGKHNPVKVHSLMGAALQMLTAGVALTIAGTLKGELPAMHFTGRTFAAFSYLVLFGSIVAFSSYNYVIQKLPLSLVSMYSYINPVIAVLLGWLILSEPLNIRVGLAAIVILSGVALVKGKKKEAVEEIEKIETETCTTAAG